MSVTVTVEKVSRYYPPTKGNKAPVLAVDNVSLGIKENETTAILGPTGCGKTTLLRMIAGLETPDRGTVYYDDIPLHQTRIEDRGIGMVFQEYALLPHRESSYSVGFFLRLRKREHEVPQRVHDVSKITGFGLDVLMDKFPKHLSGGEKQRVAIARAFARDLKLLLLDEPFANLDAKFRSDSRIELQRLLRHFPITTVLVTHDQLEAASLSDRVILMRDGHIEQVGNYHHLYDDPANHFVAEFIGTPTTNSFSGRIENGVWQGRQFGGFTVPTGVADNPAVLLTVRPDDMHLTDAGISATVISATPFYAERYLLLEVEGDGERWQIKAAPELNINPGEVIHCQIMPDNLMYFDAASGQRLG